MSDVLELGYVNAHHEDHMVRKALSWGADSLGLAEAGTGPVNRVLRKARGVRLVMGEPNVRHTADVPILTKLAHRPVGQLALRVSEQARPTRVAPERWATVSAFRHPVLVDRPIAHVNLHLNAGPKALRGDNPNVPLVREYRRSVAALDHLLTMVKALGWVPVVTGDLNLPPNVDVPWSPYRVLREHGIRWHAENIDVVAWHKRLELRHVAVLPAAEAGHKGLLARLGRG